jgi:hypothetical protein
LSFGQLLYQACPTAHLEQGSGADTKKITNSITHFAVNSGKTCLFIGRRCVTLHAAAMAKYPKKHGGMEESRNKEEG